MYIYQVQEFITDTDEENACGFYSTLEKAQDAIVKRIAEVYSDEEMECIDFTNSGYLCVTPDTDTTCSCTYEITDWCVDEELG